jgi:hypothetical protein
MMTVAHLLFPLGAARVLAQSSQFWRLTNKQPSHTDELLQSYVEELTYMSLQFIYLFAFGVYLTTLSSNSHYLPSYDWTILNN